jgi:hypothetical protein
MNVVSVKTAAPLLSAPCYINLTVNAQGRSPKEEVVSFSSGTLYNTINIKND